MRYAWKWLDSRAVTRTVQIVAVLSLILGVFVSYRQYALTGCLADYNNASASASAARSAANDQDKAAEDALWQAFQDSGDPAKVPPAKAKQYATEAFNRYLKSRADARAERDRHPLPAPPSQTCS